MISLRIRLLFALALPTASAAAHASPSSGEWEWLVAPYIWAAGVDTDLDTIVPPSQVTNSTAFSDIFDKLDGAFQVHAEAQGDQFGAFIDFTYIGLSDGSERRFFRTESDLDSRLFEAAAVWSPGVERGIGFETFAGLRMIETDLTFQLIPADRAIPRATVDVDERFDEFMLGIRYTFPMSERWSVTLRGDGSWGDTEGTWNASAVAHYRTRNGGWFFGYRHLDIDVEVRNALLNVTMSGPAVGYGFRF